MKRKGTALDDLERTYLLRVSDDQGVLREDNIEGDLDKVFIKPYATKLGGLQKAKSLGEILLDQQHLVLLGEPGSGKSTTLQFLAWCFAHNDAAVDKLGLLENRVPILLSPENLYWQIIEKDCIEVALEKEVARCLRTEGKKIPDLVKGWLRGGKLIILLDGLDEIPEKSRKIVVSELQAFARVDEYRGCRIVVSSRSAGYYQLGPLYTEFNLQPFDSRDLIRYAASWLEIAKKDLGGSESIAQAANLINRIRTEPRLSSVLSNPLFLKLFILVYSDSDPLPSHLGVVISSYVEKHLWDRAKKRKEPLWKVDDCSDALSWIAWEIQKSPELESNEDQLAKILEKNAPNIGAPKELVRFLHEGMGLLSISQYNRHVRFTDATIREYYVACRLAKQWENDSDQTWQYIIKPTLHHPRWRQTLRFISLLLQKSHAQDYVARIFKARSPFENLLHRDKMLTAAGLFWGTQISPALRLQIMPALLDIYLELLKQRHGDIPTHVHEMIDLLEQVLRSAVVEEQIFIEELLINKVLSKPKGLPLKERLNIAGREISESVKTLFRSRSSNHDEHLEELMSTVLHRDFLFKRIFREWQHTRFWNWDSNVKVAIIGIEKLRIGGPKTKELLARLLDSPWRAALAANALVALDTETPEVANILLEAIQLYRKSDGWERAEGIVDALSKLAQKSPMTVRWLLNRIRQPVEEHEQQINPHFPIAIAICKAAQTDLDAMAFVLDFWNHLRENLEIWDIDVIEGIKRGTKMMHNGTEEIFAYLINQVTDYEGDSNHAPSLLEQLLGETPKVLQKETDGRGHSWYTVVDMNDLQIENVQKAIFTMITRHPPIGQENEPFVKIIAQWVLKSPSLLFKLVNIVSDSNTRLLAEALRLEITSKHSDFDHNAQGFIQQSITRLLDSDPLVSKSEFTRWEKLAEESKSKGRAFSTWALDTVRWQKRSFFYGLYWHTFGIFWNADGWEKVKGWHPYSMAAFACFSDWKLPSSFYNNYVEWKDSEEEFRKVTDSAISVIKGNDGQIINILKSLFIAKSPANSDEAIFGDRNREAYMDERIAAAYTMARLPNNHPKDDYPDGIKFLLHTAQKLVHKDVDDWDTAPIPFSNLREHLFRSLGHVDRPNREIVQLMLDALKWDRERGHDLLIRRGIETIENPSPDAVKYLVDEYNKTSETFLKESILKPLGTVRDSSPEIRNEINNIFLNALPDDYFDTVPISTKYFSNLPNLEIPWIEKVIDLAPRNKNAMIILANQVRNISGDKLKHLSHVALQRTRVISDIYRFALLRFQEQLIELDVPNLLLEIDIKRSSIQLKLWQRVAGILGILALLGLLAVLTITVGVAQNIIPPLLDPSITEWIMSHRTVFGATLVGLAILIVPLGWLIYKLMDGLINNWKKKS